MPKMPRRTLLPLLGVALGLLLALGLLVLQRTTMPPAAAAGIGGPFTLTDQDGRTVTADDVKGEPTLVFFGYTHCPDICPTTLESISQMFKALGAARPTRALFITLDPQRDTPGVMKDYLSSFDPRIVGLTGSQDAIDAVAREYRVYAKKVPTGGGDYSVDHTGIVYLMDKNGNFVESFNPDLDKPAEAAETYAKYM
jgi:protein SCO1/2